MNFDEKMAEEYEENAEFIEIDDYGHKVYDSLDIEEAHLDGLRKGSQLDKVYAGEGTWINRDSKLEKENAELKEQLGNVKMQKAGEKSDLVWKLKTANEQKTEKLTKAKEIIEKLILQNRKLWVYSDVREEAEQFLEETE